MNTESQQQIAREAAIMLHERDQQLLSALAAIEKINKSVEGKLAPIDVDLSLLHEHDAEVRKPLVDLLEEVLSATVNTPTYPDGPCLDKSLRDDIKDALAKVKQ